MKSSRLDNGVNVEGYVVTECVSKPIDVPMSVKIHDVSYSIILSTGFPQGCVPSSFLFILLTYTNQA